MSAGATALLTGIDEMRRTPSSRDMRMIGEPRRWEAARLGLFDHHHDALPGLVSCAGVDCVVDTGPRSQSKLRAFNGLRAGLGTHPFRHQALQVPLSIRI